MNLQDRFAEIFLSLLDALLNLLTFGLWTRWQGARRPSLCRNKSASMLLVRFDSWSGNRVTYPYETYEPNLKPFSQLYVLGDLLDEAGIEDGDEFVVTITKTGKHPFGERRMILQAPNTYDWETDQQMQARLSESQ